MSLPMGGHLTHGWDVSATGRWFRGVRYGVRRDTGRIDLDEVRDLARAERPRLIFCGGTAVPRTIDFAGFAEIARETGAVLVADIAHIAGLIAGGAHPSPAGHADVVSTTTHKTLRGPRGAMLLSTAEHARAIDRAVFPGLQGGPHNQTTAAIAAALGEAATRFCSYAHQVVANARTLGEELAARGFDLVSGGTDNHLLLIDLTDKDVSGKVAAKALDRAGIVVNHNTVPYDPRKPFDPSGIRIGTPRPHLPGRPRLGDVHGRHLDHRSGRGGPHGRRGGDHEGTGRGEGPHGRPPGTGTAGVVRRGTGPRGPGRPARGRRSHGRFDGRPDGGRVVPPARGTVPYGRRRPGRRTDRASAGAGAAPSVAEAGPGPFTSSPPSPPPFVAPWID